jgi:hypothetical protein
MCENWKMDKTCRYGKVCMFAHGEKELNSHLYAELPVENEKSEVSPPI